MKKPNFCAIFATMFVAATVIMLASCSQDDEYYEDGLFTRADEMMTRAGEPGGNTPTPPTPPPVQKIAAGADTSYYRELFPVILELVISWPEGYTSVTAHPVNPSLKVNFLDELYIDAEDSIRYEIIGTTAQWFGGSAVSATFTYIGKNIYTDSIKIGPSTHGFIETVEKVFLTD